MFKRRQGVPHDYAAQSTSTGLNTLTHRLVDRYLVDEYTRVADGLQIYSILIALVGGAFLTCCISLGAGVLHPVTMYLVMAGTGIGTLILAFVIAREIAGKTDVKRTLDAVSMEIPVSFTMQVTVPGSPSLPTSTGFTGPGSQANPA
jgi:hypothetical protein